TQGSTTKSIIDENAITIANAFGSGTPFIEKFSTNEGWVVDNYDQKGANNTWKHNTSVGFDDAGCYQMHNLGAESGAWDDLTFASVDCRAMTKIDISFQVAYAQIVASNSDKIELFVSADCG